ncbi:hypothetical protein V8F33_007896 [Rhypophila sp. PSN 637]
MPLPTSKITFISLLLLLFSQVCTTVAQWSVRNLNTFSPSGRPGSSPYSTLNTTITDTYGHYDAHLNRVPLSTAICFMKWQWGSRDITPYNIVFNCSNVDPNDTDSHWSFEMRNATESEYPSPTTDFYLWFWRSVENIYNDGHGSEKGGRFTKRGPVDELAAVVERNDKPRREARNILYVGHARFKVGPGENMEGICGASGVCSYNLRQEKTPVLIERQVI